MSRYVDADKFKDFMNISFDSVGLMVPVSASLVREIKEYVKKQIDEQPTADVVPKEKYDRLLENATILADEVQKYEKMFEAMGGVKK